MNPYGIAHPDRSRLFAEIEDMYRATQRSIDEYAAHPLAACPWRPNLREAPCQNLTDGVALCRDHLSDSRVCCRCKKVQPEKHHAYCPACKLVRAGLCVKCGTRRAERQRRQCSTCAHGGLKGLAAGRMRARRRGGAS